MEGRDQLNSCWERLNAAAIQSHIPVDMALKEISPCFAVGNALSPLHATICGTDSGDCLAMDAWQQDLESTEKEQ